MSLLLIAYLFGMLWKGVVAVPTGDEDLAVFISVRSFFLSWIPQFPTPGCLQKLLHLG